jgi:hypothetical protein
MFVYILGGEYDIRRENGLRSHDICTKFLHEHLKQLSNITVNIATISEEVMILMIEEMYKVCFEMVLFALICIPSLVKIGEGVQIILRF